MLEDWFRILPREKSQLFDTVFWRWQCAYWMMSVALDEAISLRRQGRLVSARQQVAITADLFERLALSLLSFCDVVACRGRRVIDIPPVNPLNAEFFRGSAAQSAAWWNGVVHHVLFGDRFRFLHKVRVLSETIEKVRQQFDDSAAEIARGVSIRPFEIWENFDALHYDLNTCLREAQVMLKSFLRALPTDQLPVFATELDAAPEPKRTRLRTRLSDASA